MSRTLFVYGTLRPSLAPAAVRGVVGTFVPRGPATVIGTLYDLGRYPGLVLDAAGGVAGDTVHGELFDLPGDDTAVTAALRRLDRYEGYDLARPATSGFVRVECTPVTAEGMMLAAWAYVYNRPVDPSRRIAAGRWPTDATPPGCS